MVLLQRHVHARTGGTDTWRSVDNLLVGDRELTQEMSNHLGFDLDCDKFLTRMQMQRQTQHLRYDDHIPRVGLDRFRFSSTITVLSLRLPNMFEQCPLVVGQTLEQRPPLARRK